MCMIVKETKNFKPESIKWRDDKITAYKVVFEEAKSGLYHPPFMSSGEPYIINRRNYIKSDRYKSIKKDMQSARYPDIKFDSWDYICVWGNIQFEITRGIHVFLNEKDAKNLASNKGKHYKVIPVTCHKRDFCAIGVWSDDWRMEQAVFTKIQINNVYHQEKMKKNWK